MIHLSLRTESDQTYDAYFNGTYSNAVDHYLGKLVNSEMVIEVLEIMTTPPDTCEI